MSVIHDGDFERDCVSYLRKSKGVTIAKQRRENAKHAAEKRWRIIAEFIDTNATAHAAPGEERARRPKYEAMLRTLATDTSQPPLGVLAWHADRILRDPRDTEDVIAICSRGRNPIETARSGRYEVWTATGIKRLRADVNDAAYEVDHLIERVTSDKTERAMEGAWLGGPVPFGWQHERLSIDDDEKALVLDPEQADAIKWGCEQVLLGASLGSIAKQWNQRGLRRRRGAPFDSGEVRRVLLRARNAGLMVHKKVITETDLEGGVAAWPPIVSEDVWRAVAEILTTPDENTPMNSRARNWLGSSIYLCGRDGGCGHTLRTAMGSGGTSQGRRTMVVYRCRSNEAGHPVRSARDVDDYVGAVMIERFSRPDVRDWLAAEEPANLGEIRARINVQRAELAQWRALAEAGEIEPVSFVAAERGCLARIKALRAELNAARSSPIIADLVDGGDMGVLWDTRGLEWQRSVVRLFAEVKVIRTRPGRPPGWRAGQPYFDTSAVRFHWKPLGGREAP